MAPGSPSESPEAVAPAGRSPQADRRLRWRRWTKGEDQREAVPPGVGDEGTGSWEPEERPARVSANSSQTQLFEKWDVGRNKIKMKK